VTEEGIRAELFSKETLATTRGPGWIWREPDSVRPTTLCRECFNTEVKTTAADMNKALQHKYQTMLTKENNCVALWEKHLSSTIRTEPHPRLAAWLAEHGHPVGAAWTHDPDMEKAAVNEEMEALLLSSRDRVRSLSEAEYCKHVRGIVRDEELEQFL
jgi:hypothetical protein